MMAILLEYQKFFNFIIACLQGGRNVSERRKMGMVQDTQEN